MKYENIKRLLKKNGEIDYIRAMVIKLYPNSHFYSLKCLIFSLFFTYEINYINKDSKILISSPSVLKKRKDYLKINLMIKEIIKEYNEIIFIEYFNLKNFFRKISIFLYKYWNFKESKITFFDKIRIVSLEVLFEEMLEKLNKITFSEELLITFCDAYFEENLLTQYLQNKMKTSTLQHGQYRILRKGYETADVEAYENFISDYLFAWGEKTKKEFLKFGVREDKILVVGALKEFYKNYAKNQIKKTKKICILLNGEIYEKSNFELLKYVDLFCKENGYKYYLRPHPMNKLNKYLKRINNSNLIKVIDAEEYEILENEIEFNILHMTGVFVELLSKNKIFFVFDDKWTENIFKLEGFIFKNEIELYDNYQKLNEDRELYLKKLKENYLEFNCVRSKKDLETNYQVELKKIGVL